MFVQTTPNQLAKENYETRLDIFLLVLGKCSIGLMLHLLHSSGLSSYDFYLK